MGTRVVQACSARRARWRRRAALLSVGAVPLLLSSCYGSISGGKSETITTTAAAASSGPTKLVSELFTAGEAELNKKNFHGAIEDFSTVALLSGVTKAEIALANFDVAVAYVTEEGQTTSPTVRAADLAAAIAALKKALVADPKYGFALNDLAVLVKPTDPKFAISLYKRLLKTNPSDKASVYTNLGNLLLVTGQADEGQKDLAIASSLSASQTPTGPSGSSK